jgi:hypothetical protein
MDQINDFFFGSLSYNNEVPSVPLYSLNNLSNKVSSQFFSQQLSRLLSSNGRELIITDDSTSPSFHVFLNKLSDDHIGFIEIHASTDINGCVDRTLTCEMFLLSGHVSVRPHWCAWKELRSNEIVTTLLVPLHLRGLEKNTYIRWDNGDTELLSKDDDYKTELENIFRLSGYPDTLNYCHPPGSILAYYTKHLNIAKDIASMNLPIDQVWDKYYELLDLDSKKEMAARRKG